ncbi:(2Fe-2S)-binding protein [Halalkalibacter urbisdiaboli]|uniref:(2Fe-2S)-binding protein n=1 Tax=Halalkalibacter urbisdiaboli TaxID=1960589 RepID=UPI000B44DBE9|nr:(2Fe-2S)-binding protein [Halalkalibacter urbisdiaboli]
MGNLDFEQLKKYGSITDEDHPAKVYEVTLAQLLQSEAANAFTAYYAEKLKATDVDVAATYFSSSFGYICAALQTVLSTELAIPSDRDQITVQLYYNKEHDYYALSYKLANLQCVSEANANWRREQLVNFYKQVVTPVLEALSQSTSIRIRELWGQLVGGLHYGHKIGLTFIEEAQKDIVKQDFNWLLEKAAPEIFRCDKNPLSFPIREIESLKEPGTMIRMKPTCCLYYKTEKSRGTKCYTCPRLSEAEREDRKKQLVASTT